MERAQTLNISRKMTSRLQRQHCRLFTFNEEGSALRPVMSATFNEIRPGLCAPSAQPGGQGHSRAAPASSNVLKDQGPEGVNMTTPSAEAARYL